MLSFPLALSVPWFYSFPCLCEHLRRCLGCLSLSLLCIYLGQRRPIVGQDAGIVDRWAATVYIAGMSRKNRKQESPKRRQPVTVPRTIGGLEPRSLPLTPAQYRALLLAMLG